jgi:2,4-dienoyl-CoA reductase-like NADH-dependent reductase (Old Yellow Enzyme family)
MSNLFQELKIKDLTLKNRIAVPPMCQYSAQEDGVATDWHLAHYGSFAVGQSAVVIQEATAVTAQGRITRLDLGLWSDAHIAPLKRVVDFVHEQNCLFGVQLAHAGRKASSKVEWENEILHPWQVVAPSAIAFDEHSQTPKELTKDEIKTLVNDFKSAAKRAIDAGYDILELHAAHGYLIHEFLSPLSNHRTDEYGGSFENRIRFLVEIVEAINPLLTSKISLWVRISATDWAEQGGWDLEQSVELVKKLKRLNVDVVDASTGGLIPHVKIPFKPNYQVPFAKKIKQETGMITGAVGLITTCAQAEEILYSGDADLISIGREMLRDPHFPMRAAYELRENIDWAKQYRRAKP